MNHPIRVCFADDDAGMRLMMRKLLEKSGDFEIVGEAEDGEALLQLALKEHPQLVMLDVEMPRLTGVECAKILQDTDPKIMLIFMTAHETYMADAFSVYAFDYLLKPFKTERALQTLERVKQVMDTRRQAEAMAAQKALLPRPSDGRIMLRHREGISFLNLDYILMVQRENRVTVLYTLGDGRYETTDSLGEMEQRLDGPMFFRCHKSYIINLNHIENILPYGRWTYIVRLRGTKQDALITHEKYEELEKMYS